MTNVPVYVAFRLTPEDLCFLPNFLNYYKNLNVTGFFSNLNYRIDCDDSKFNYFIDTIRRLYPEIIFNVGPNNLDLPESKNITQIYELMKEHISPDSYIIPADADEFHEYPFESLEENISYLKQNNFLYIKGSTNEKVSTTGELYNIEPNKSLFGQFPKSNKFLFGKPKISLMSNIELYQKSGIGHHDFFHNVDVEIKKAMCNKHSKTHHFRWSVEGKNRTLKWHNLWKNDTYKGYKNLRETEKRLKAYELNLLEENWSSFVVESL